MPGGVKGRLRREQRRREAAWLVPCVLRILGERGPMSQDDLTRAVWMAALTDPQAPHSWTCWTRAALTSPACCAARSPARCSGRHVSRYGSRYLHVSMRRATCLLRLSNHAMAVGRNADFDIDTSRPVDRRRLIVAVSRLLNQRDDKRGA